MDSAWNLRDNSSFRRVLESVQTRVPSRSSDAWASVVRLRRPRLQRVDEFARSEILAEIVGMYQRRLRSYCLEHSPAKSWGSTMQVVAVMNYKGGGGKTTLTANLGAEVANRGHKVLLIDLDPQANLTFSFYTVDQWREELRKDTTIMRWYEGDMPGREFGLHRLVVPP